MKTKLYSIGEPTMTIYERCVQCFYESMMEQKITQSALKDAEGKNPFEDDTIINMAEVFMENVFYTQKHINLTDDEVMELFDTYIKTDSDLGVLDYILDEYYHTIIGEVSHDEAKKIILEDRELFGYVSRIILTNLLGNSNDFAPDMSIYAKVFDEAVKMLPN